MKFSIRTDVGAVMITVRELRARVRDLRPAWNSFHDYMMGETGMTFRALAHGGTYRGVTWKPFADQYTRNTDGVTVPAWGGVERIRAGRSTRTAAGRRTVLYKRAYALMGAGASAFRTRTRGPVRGRLRPSGKRVTKDSNLMRDTGKMSGEAGMNMRGLKTIRPKSLVMFVRQGYAQAQNAMRPFLFFNVPKDADKATQIISEHIAGIVPGKRAALTGSFLAALRSL